MDPIPLDQMTEEQRDLHDLIAKQRSRGQVQGPFAVMLRAPDVCERVAEMVNHLLQETRVPLTLKELAIITIARQYTAQYEWYVHAKRAKEVGLDDTVIDAIRHCRRPDFNSFNESLVYDMTMEMVEKRQLGDALYASAMDAFGDAALVELVALIGFYVMIAVFLVSFEVAVPDPDAVLLSN
jgi:4-carboxymuconolactone decarboxylase